MEVVWLISLLLLPFLLPDDPSPGAFRTKTELRDLDCEYTTVEAASERYPGRIARRAPRGELIERSVVICQERLMQPGMRLERDEAILSSLRAQVSGLTSKARALQPALTERTWLVETHYPSAPVAEKITFATQSALVSQGLTVSDRAPMLAVGDVDVLIRMPPGEAWPAACRRYHDTGSLGEGDVLLAVMVRDLRETALHGGLCVEGQWMWLQ